MHRGQCAIKQKTANLGKQLGKHGAALARCKVAFLRAVLFKGEQQLHLEPWQRTSANATWLPKGVCKHTSYADGAMQKCRCQLYVSNQAQHTVDSGISWQPCRIQHILAATLPGRHCT